VRTGRRRQALKGLEIERNLYDFRGEAEVLKCRRYGQFGIKRVFGVFDRPVHYRDEAPLWLKPSKPGD